MFNLTTPITALLVALAGLGLSLLWFNCLGWLAVLVAIAVTFVGWALDRVGLRLPPQRPVWVIRFLQWWILTPAAIAAIASGAVIVIAVQFTIPSGSGLSAEDQKMMGAFATAFTALLTAGFISWTAAEKDSRLSEHIKEAFFSKYGRVGDKNPPDAHEFEEDTDGENWVLSYGFGGVEGWGPSARAERAQGIAVALEGTTDPGA